MRPSDASNYEDGVFRPLEPVSLKDRKEVRLVLETIESLHENESTSRPIWEFAAERARDVPDEEWRTLPSDGAAELDHDLYGTSKGR